MTMTTETPVIETSGLVRRYGRTEAVNGLDLRVLPGPRWNLEIERESSLYVSSLSASGLKALLLSIPGIWFVVALLGFLAAQIDRALYALSWDRSIAATIRDAASLTLWLSFGVAAGFFALVLWFAMLNHRSSERAFARACPRRSGCVAICWLDSAWYRSFWRNR
jgi:hypothetical protein